jgi:hypothetical protein
LPDEARRAAPRRAFGRALRIALASFAALAVLYLVGMNLFLGTRWFRSAINFSPEQFRIEYSRAYSIVPGEIHVEGLSIRGSDGAVEWILRLDRCDFHMQFLDLLHRQFHADHVRGSGLSMRLRLRLLQEDATPDVVAALPPVPGFSDPPYLEIGPPTAPLTDAEYRLWSVRLDDVDAQHVREIWVQTLRYAGDIRVRGRWLFRPVRWLEIGPATIDVSSMDVSYGSTFELLKGLHGTIDATMHPFDVRAPDGLEILKYVTAKTSLTGSAETAQIFDKLALAPSVKFVRGEGPLDLQLVIDHGMLRPGCHLSTSSAETEVAAKDTSVYGAIAAELRVESEGEESVAHADVDASNLRAEKNDLEVARAASLSIRLASRDLDLAKPSIDTASFKVGLGGGEAPSVAFLRTLFPSGVFVDSGVVRADGYLDGRLADESAHGQLGFTVHDLSLARGTTRASANAQGTLKVDSSSLRDGNLDLTESRLALDDVTAAASGVHLRAPALDLRAMRAVLRRGAQPDVDVNVDLPQAELTDLRNILPPGSALSITGGQASASLHLDADVSSLSAEGSANLVARGLRVQVGSDTYQGELNVALQARRLGADGKTTGISGSTLAFASGGAPSTDDWWAKVSLSDAALRLADENRFRAAVHLTAANASPAKALLAKVTIIPRWVLDTFPMKDLHADGEIREAPSSFEARSIVARGSGSNVVQLEYATHDAGNRGMALLSTGSVHLGFTLAGPGKKLQIFDGEDSAETWFGQQVAALRAHANDR